MRRESHVRICEGAGGQFPRATRPFIPVEMNIGCFGVDEEDKDNEINIPTHLNGYS